MRSLTFIGLPRWLGGGDPPANTGDAGSIPGSGRSPMAAHSNILAWKIPWTEAPGRTHSVGLQRSQTRLID